MQEGNKRRDVQEIDNAVLIYISQQKRRFSLESADVYRAVEDAVKPITTLISQQRITIGIDGKSIVPRVDRWAVGK